MGRLSWVRIWPLAAVVAVVASMAITLQASAEGPSTETGGTPLNISIVIPPEAVDQLAGLLKQRYLPQQAREAIASILEQAGYDPTELAALLERSKHGDDDEHHDRKGNFCEDVLANPAEHEEYVARCQFLQDIGTMTPQEVCDRALGNAEADAAFIESLVKRCRNAIKGDEALKASVCASVQAAGVPERLLQACMLDALGELTPQETCARVLAAAPADEPILGILTSRCKSEIKHADSTLRAELCGSITSAAAAPEVLVNKCERLAAEAERAAQKAALNDAMEAFYACKKAAPDGESHEAKIARCAAEVQAQFGVTIDTSKFSGDKVGDKVRDKHRDGEWVKDQQKVKSQDADHDGECDDKDKS
ncbi:MAG: hypothetical protein R3C39_05395 [Dehalococcoidia bacterium]